MEQHVQVSPVVLDLGRNLIGTQGSAQEARIAVGSLGFSLKL